MVRGEPETAQLHVGLPDDAGGGRMVSVVLEHSREGFGGAQASVGVVTPQLARRDEPEAVVKNHLVLPTGVSMEGARCRPCNRASVGARGCIVAGIEKRLMFGRPSAVVQHPLGRRGGVANVRSVYRFGKMVRRDAHATAVLYVDRARNAAVSRLAQRLTRGGRHHRVQRDRLPAHGAAPAR
eukprot:scaffold7832_cov106-Isochrysis_galbana.AAC.12